LPKFYKLFRVLECIAAHNILVLPPIFMESVKAAIRRDGIGLARVPPQFENELTKIGGTDPIEMLRFRVSCLPRDSSSWKIVDVCLYAVVKRIEARALRMVLNNYINRADQHMLLYPGTEVNVFYDVLLNLLRRVWISMMEIAVSLYFNQFRTKIGTRS
jgi:hypothetical protein